MKRIVVFSVLLAAGGATAQLAPEAASKPRTLEVVIDRDANLALVPEGTVIPSGVSLSIPATDDTEKAERRLVFAYAGAKRFRALREFRARVESERTPVAPGEELWMPIEPEAPTRALVTAACPADVFLETGPEVYYRVNCIPYPYPYPGYSWAIQESFEQEPNLVTSRLVSFLFNTGYVWNIRFQLTSPQWSGTSYVTYSNVSATYSVVTRVPGPCTQDPPWCPPVYSASVKFDL